MKDTEIFVGKKLSDLLKEIHETAGEKRRGIDGVINQLVDQIKTPDDARLLAPLIREFFEVGVKNDEQLVKMAAIIQRILADESTPGESDIMLSDEERERLIKNALSDLQKIEEKVQDLTSKVS
jgi:SMC interacting uncharacterized protein involved in chromosome segregation